MKSQELLQELVLSLETFDVTEDEEKLLIEYIQKLVSDFSLFYDYFEKDENKLTIVKFLEEIAGEKNV